MVIRLFYEEERRKAKERQATSTGGTTPQLIPNLDEAGDKSTTNEILAKKAGIGKSSMANLLAVYKSREDLFERVFNGEISINKAYTQMKAKKWTTLSQIEAEKARSRNVTHCANCSRALHHLGRH